MLLPRVLTSLLLVPLVVAVVWFGAVPFFLFTTAICLLSVWEYSVMAEEGGYPNQRVIGLLGSLFVLLALYFDGAPAGPLRHAPGPSFILLLWVFVMFFREFLRRDKGHSLLRIITTLAGVLLFSFFLGHLILIRDLRLAVGEGVSSAGRPITFFLFLIVWSVDVGAWLVGRLAGRAALAPRVSPQKTWEGSVGGTLIACGAGWFLREIMLRDVMGPVEAVLYALLIAVVAQFSDLVESLIKRSFGAKDSSQLLPGHGGILDRFDSFVFAAPFYYYILIGTGRFH